MDIKVEQRHIELGRRGDAGDCAVAQALRDHYPGCPIYVGCDFADIAGAAYTLDPTTSLTIAALDIAGGMVEPFTATLIPSQCHWCGSNDEVELNPDKPMCIWCREAMVEHRMDQMQLMKEVI